MSDDWYSKIAKTGLLGTHPKASAEYENRAGADWYKGKNQESALDSARKKVVDTASRLGNMLQPKAGARENGD